MPFRKSWDYSKKASGRIMTIYVNEKCRRCGESLTGGYVPNYFSVGSPISKCLKCGTLYSRGSKQNEWALIGPVRKMGLLLLSTYWGLAWAATLGGLVLPALIAASTGSEMGTVLVEGYTWIIPLSLSLGGGFSFLGLYRQILASNRRMKDPNYKLQLRQLGYEVT